jgi:hypothetical protein
MGKLAEYVRTEAEHLKADMHRRKEAVAEWKGAIDRLYKQLVGWIAEADGGHNLLAAHPERLAFVREPRLGSYEIQCLRIELGSRDVEVAPRARHVVATIAPPGAEPRRADGMVELTDRGVAMHYMFRLIENGVDRWYIQSVGLWNIDAHRGSVEPLERDRFEAAVLDILQ